MPIQLVVFDMAGTTVYDEQNVSVALRDALDAAHVSVSHEAVQEVMGLYKPLAIRLLLERVRSEAAALPEEVQAIFEDFQARMLTHYRTHPSVREIAGTSAVFQTLRERGVKIALDTGFSRPIADAIIERLGWAQAGWIDASVTSDEVPNGRPHPDMVYRAMELTGVSDVTRVAKVGDTPSDLEEGRAAGCGVNVGVTGGSHTHAQLAPYPHTHLITTIAELPAILF